MTHTLLTDIHTLVTMRGDRSAPAEQITDAAVLLRDNVIAWVGRAAEAVVSSDGLRIAGQPVIPSDALTVRSLHDHIVLPGLINTHHHLYQTLTRCIAQDSGLFNWLKTLYPIWLGLTSEAIYASALTGMAELMLSGCTTASDHLYIYPNDCTHRRRDSRRARDRAALSRHARQHEPGRDRRAGCRRTKRSRPRRLF